ncbi:MAG: maleylpyruvate isomerase N-terminal domain-containing protein [Acidimicrobiia bacterium]
MELNLTFPARDPEVLAVIREVFLDSAGESRIVLASRDVSAAWDRPSALDEMTVGALAGHLMRAVTGVDAYLDTPAPPGDEVLDAPGYFQSIDGLTDRDLHNDLHTAIRARADQETGAGPDGVVARWDDSIRRLEARLPAEPLDRVLPALGGRLILLDHYLVTRLVEMLVHTDDLAVSVGLERPRFPNHADTAVIDCLVEVARRRHGTAAVIAALARRERDTVDALRVL